MQKSNPIDEVPNTEAFQEHCLEIVNCEVAAAVLTTPLRSLQREQRQCVAIINAQLDSAPEPQPNVPPWLVPEPWNGYLDKAKILFIGQNPSADHDEDYPMDENGIKLKENSELFNYFQNRFETEPPGSILDGRKVRRRDGTFGRSNPFLTRVKKIAADILGDKVTVTPGKDYAITEAVRCKAAKAIGIELAVDTCATRHLAKTLELSTSLVIVCMGVHARKGFQIATGCTNETLAESFDWGKRKVIYMAHSNARPNANGRTLPDEQINILRNHLQSADSDAI